MVPVTVCALRSCDQLRETLVPDGRDVLGPLSVQGLCPLLQLVQLVLDHLHPVPVPALFCHRLQTENER